MSSRWPKPPGFYDARRGPHRAWSAREVVQLGHDLLDLRPRSKSFGEHCLRNVLHSKWSEQLHVAVQSRRLDNVYLYSLESVFAQQPWQTWADVRVTASVLQCLGEEVDESPECGAVRIAKLASNVSVSDDDDSSRTDGPADFSQRRGRIP